MHRQPFDVAVSGAVVASAAMALYFGMRYGEPYRIGDSAHRRDTSSDFAFVAGPMVAMVVCLFVLAVRRTNPQGFRAEWRRERDELRAAKQARERSDG